MPGAACAKNRLSVILCMRMTVNDFTKPLLDRIPALYKPEPHPEDSQGPEQQQHHPYAHQYPQKTHTPTCPAEMAVTQCVSY